MDDNLTDKTLTTQDTAVVKQSTQALTMAGEQEQNQPEHAVTVSQTQVQSAPNGGDKGVSAVFNLQEEIVPERDSNLRNRVFFFLAWGLTATVMTMISYALFKSLEKWYFVVLSIVIGVVSGFLLALGIRAILNIFTPTIQFKDRENHRDYHWMDVDWPHHPDV